MEILIGIAIFISIVLLIQGFYFVFRTMRNPEKREVKNRLRAISSVGYRDQRLDIERKKLLSKIPWLNRLLSAFRWLDRLHRLLEQADLKQPLGVFLLLSFLLAFIGLILGFRGTSNIFVGILLAILLGIIPFFYVHLKKKRRMKKFQEQLPEALDLIARSLKAGHAFLGGLKMVADEMGDPIGTEFGRTVGEINFGVDFPEALKNLLSRVDCPDLKFFIISIILQRETGGNLVEILEKIATLIRERFKLYGRVRVLAAQGKLSAAILIALPFVVGLGFSILNPKYIGTLGGDPIGKVLVIFALLLIIFGIVVIRKIIDIKV